MQEERQKENNSQYYNLEKDDPILRYLKKWMRRSGMLLGWIPSNISVGIPLYSLHSYLKSDFSPVDDS